MGVEPAISALTVSSPAGREGHRAAGHRTTTSDAWTEWTTVYRLDDPAWRIVRVSPREGHKLPPNMRIEGQQGADRPEVYTGPSGSIVTEFRVFADHTGDDVGAYTRLETVWTPLTITEESVVPPWLR